MQVRNYTLLGDSAVAAVRARLDAAVAPWSAEWGIDAAALTCQRAAGSAHVPDAPWRQGWQGGAGRLWLSWSATMQAELQHAMFAPEAGRTPEGSGNIAGEAGAAAFDALLHALATALLPGAVRSDSVPANEQFASGAGTLLLQVQVCSHGSHGCRVLLDAAAVAALAPPAVPAVRPPLAPVNYLDAVRHTPLKLGVRAGQAELGLGALMSVAVGDVIRLDASVEAPVAVLAPSGQPLFAAWLGQTEGQLAVEVERRF